jgi:thiol:disulfide interchange protein DsbD
MQYAICSSLLLPACLAIVASAQPAPAKSPGQAYVQATLTTDTTHFTPGQPFTAAVTLTIAPQWHVYWINPGDSGLPTQISWQLPPGWTAGPLLYPIPKKFNQPGDILGYGYESQVTFLTQITPSATATTAAEISANLTYLVCHEVCLPGQANLSAKLQPASGTSTPSPAAPAIASARERLPAPEPIAPETTYTRDANLITVQSRLATPLDGSLPTTGTWQLFPFPDDHLEWQDPTATPEPGDVVLTARIRLLTPAAQTTPKALLVHTNPAGQSTAWEIAFPPTPPDKSTNKQSPAAK